MDQGGDQIVGDPAGALLVDVGIAAATIVVIGTGGVALEAAAFGAAISFIAGEVLFGDD